MIYLELFISFFQVGLFCFGGGYAALPLIQDQVMVQHDWLSMTEFTHLVTISQMTPGPIGINASTFVGTKMAGVGGAAVATLGFVTPSFILMSILAWVYFKYRNTNVLKDVLSALKPAVVALIGTAGFDIIVTALWGQNAISIATTDYLMLALLVFSFALLRSKRLSAVKVMILAGVVNLALAMMGIGV